MTQTTNQEIREFLSALFGRYFQKHNGYVELRFVPKEEGATFSKFYRLADFEFGRRDELLAGFPRHKALIGRMTVR